MTRASDLIDQFRSLTPEEQEQFLHSLALWLDLHLPDGKCLIISKQEYARLVRASGIVNNDALYEIAKQVCLQYGMPWTDPRSGETFKP